MQWNRKKKELWEMNKSPYQRFRINFKIAMDKYNRRTHGLGLLFMILIGALIVVTIIPLLYTPTIKQRIQSEIIIGNCDIGDRCYKFA